MLDQRRCVGLFLWPQDSSSKGVWRESLSFLLLSTNIASILSTSISTLAAILNSNDPLPADPLSLFNCEAFWIIKEARSYLSYYWLSSSAITCHMPWEQTTRDCLLISSWVRVFESPPKVRYARIYQYVQVTCGVDLDHNGARRQLLKSAMLDNELSLL